MNWAHLNKITKLTLKNGSSQIKKKNVKKMLMLWKKVKKQKNMDKNAVILVYF